MSKLGTSKKPLILRVRNFERAEEIAARCDKLKVMFILGIEENEPEDLTDLDRYLQKPKAMASSFWRLR
jgi:hypothetical protein